MPSTLNTSNEKPAHMLRPAFLLLPLATAVGYFLTDSFFLRSSITLLCLAIVFYINVVQRRECKAWWIVAAFALSFMGDYVLGHWGGCLQGFLLGGVLFLLAHTGYIGYSLSRGRIVWLLLLLLLVVFGAYHVILLHPAIGNNITSPAVLAYIIVSCLSMSAAAGIQTDTSQSVDLSATCSCVPSVASDQKSVVRCPWSVVLYILGIASLLFSDFLIAEKRFLHEGSFYFLMMPTYFASQFLVTASLLLTKPSRGIVCKEKVI